MQAVSPDGGVLATGGRKGCLHLWQLQDNPDADPARSHSRATVMVEDAEVRVPLEFAHMSRTQGFQWPLVSITLSDKLARMRAIYQHPHCHSIMLSESILQSGCMHGLQRLTMLPMNMKRPLRVRMRGQDS